jgi:hypothetical protein
MEHQWTLVVVLRGDPPLVAVKQMRQRVRRQEAVDMLVQRLGARPDITEVIAIPGMHTFHYHRRDADGAFRKRPGPGRFLPG